MLDNIPVTDNRFGDITGTPYDAFVPSSIKYHALWCLDNAIDVPDIGFNPSSAETGI